MGFGWDAVQEMNPRIVYAQIKGFAPEVPSPNSFVRQIAQSTGGGVSVTGDPAAAAAPGDERRRYRYRPAMRDRDLSALYQRQSPAEASVSKVAMQEAVTNLARVGYRSASRTVEGARRNGNASVNSDPRRRLYPCKGGGPNDMLHLLPRGAGLGRILKAMGREDLAGDPRFSTGNARAEHRAEVDELVSTWTRAHDKVTVMKALGELGVPAGAIFDTEDLCNDAHLRQRGAVDPSSTPFAASSRCRVFRSGCPTRR